MTRALVTVPRKLSPPELKAAELRAQGAPLHSIIIQTALSEQQIEAAVERKAAWDALHAEKARKAAAAEARKNGRNKPADRDEKIRTLTACIDVVRKKLAEYEAELRELGVEPPEAAPEPVVEDVVAEPEPPAPEPVPEPPTAAVVPTLANLPEVIRQWAIADGWDVPDGRLPGAIVLAYHRAHGGAP